MGPTSYFGPLLGPSLLGPPVVPFFLGEGSPTEKSWYPYSNLSTATPRLPAQDILNYLLNYINKNPIYEEARRAPAAHPCVHLCRGPDGHPLVIEMIARASKLSMTILHWFQHHEVDRKALEDQHPHKRLLVHFHVCLPKGGRPKVHRLWRCSTTGCWSQQLLLYGDVWGMLGRGLCVSSLSYIWSYKPL